MFDSFTKILVAHGFKHWMPGVRVTGYIVYYRRPSRWKFWQKEYMFLLKGEWSYAGVGNVFKYGKYQDGAAELFGNGG